jgi:hypothetical protein
MIARQYGQLLILDVMTQFSMHANSNTCLQSLSLIGFSIGSLKQMPERVVRSYYSPPLVGGVETQ